MSVRSVKEQCPCGSRDEIHSDSRYMQDMFTHRLRWQVMHRIWCTSLWKTFNVAGLRLCEYFQPSAELENSMIRRLMLYSYSASNTFGLRWVQAAYSPEAERHGWKNSLVYLQGKWRLFQSGCQHNVGFTAPQGTFYVGWISAVPD